MMTTRKRIRTKLRRLTIGYHYYDQRRDGDWAPPRPVPFLRLGGDWLQQAGFEIGQHVQVCVTAQRIVIVPAAILTAAVI
jgi:toxic protein SymE